MTVRRRMAMINMQSWMFLHLLRSFGKLLENSLYCRWRTLVNVALIQLVVLWFQPPFVFEELTKTTMRDFCALVKVVTMKKRTQFKASIGLRLVLSASASDLEKSQESLLASSEMINFNSEILSILQIPNGMGLEIMIDF